MQEVFGEHFVVGYTENTTAGGAGDKGFLIRLLGTSLSRIFQIYNTFLVVVRLEFLGFMVIMSDMSSVAVSKNQIKVEGDRVIMTLKEYRDLLKKSAPTYYLKGKAAMKLDKLVEKGLREHKAGRIRVLKSLADLD